MSTTVNRNALCPCGSGKLNKFCCGKKPRGRRNRTAASPTEWSLAKLDRTIKSFPMRRRVYLRPDEKPFTAPHVDEGGFDLLQESPEDA